MQIAAVDAALIDAVAHAAFAFWQYNGHDVPGALAAVYQHHVDPAVRDAAGEAHTAVLTTPVIWRGFEIDFEKRAAADR